MSIIDVRVRVHVDIDVNRVRVDTNVGRSMELPASASLASFASLASLASLKEGRTNGNPTLVLLSILCFLLLFSPFRLFVLLQPESRK